MREIEKKMSKNMKDMYMYIWRSFEKGGIYEKIGWQKNEINWEKDVHISKFSITV